MSDRDFDLVLFGATSFVGQILTGWLAERAPDDLRWAIAGRDADKLDGVAEQAGVDVEQITADATDEAAMGELAARADTIASTVGPYALYGSPLVAAVAAAGTDYCDLTGELQWVREMIGRHQETAAASGARIVHTCGFDSVPSDLGVWFTQEQAIERFGRPCSSIALRVETMRGGASGGTIASMLNLVEDLRADPALRRELQSPYALAPADMRDGPAQPSVMRPTLDGASGQWVAPFVMAMLNERVVHRSHALLGRPWGEDFTYDEAMLAGAGPLGAAKASAIAGGLAGVAGMAVLAPSRRVLARFLPAPGEGPTPAQQEAGCFDLRLYGRTDAGDEITTRVTGDRDPGYGSTAKMMAEAALAFPDVPRERVPGGFWTPATAFGDLLVDRLVEHAGLTFDVI